MAQIIRYVDPDATGGGNGMSWTDAYTSLQTCLQTEATELVSAGDYFTAKVRSSEGTPDTTAVSILTSDGWVLDETHYIEVIQDDFPPFGIFDSSKYILSITNSSLRIVAPYVRFHNVQINFTATGSTSINGIHIDVGSAQSRVYIDSCVIKGNITSTGTIYGFRNSGTNSIARIYNSIFYSFDNETDDIGIRNSFGQTYVYNCTVYDCGIGMSNGIGALTAVNCIVGNCNTDFSGCTVSYCCSDSGTGSSPQTPSGGDWDNELNDAANGDFSIRAGGNCIGNGNDNPGAGLYSDDLIGNVRS